ncbi:MAG: 50S ribosomal protein L3 [Phycisphaerales bacterium]|nr:MAG: 50S ribosomal protein L3 [Phycisphaerales bacterium]
MAGNDKLGLIGRKIGMTRVYTDKGVSIPVTAIEVPPAVVTQVRTPERDGYSAVQLGAFDARPRRSTFQIMGHDAKAGTGPKAVHAESRMDAQAAEAFELGQQVTVEHLAGFAYVDVTGTSKGKGFAGTMKRHNFKGLRASHGVERKHRSPGSIGGHATNRGFSGKLKKGKRMNGQLGNERVTIRNLDVVKVEPERNLLLVKGPVPGANGSVVRIRPSVRLRPAKAKAQQEAAAG